MARLLPLMTAAAICWSAATPARAADQDVTIAPREVWSTVFAESAPTFSFDIVGGREQEARLLWSFAAQGRTIARGERLLRLRKRAAAPVAIRLAIPPVRDGVVFPATLTLAIQAADQSRLAECQKPLWIFPRDPFFERRAWLRELPLHLFDPLDDTAEVLQAARVPFQRVHNSAALESIDAGLLIVGEGVSWAEHHTLPDAVCRLAAIGVPVLCLAPAEGQLPLPGPRGEPRLVGLTFRDAESLRQLDKRLDADGWPPAGGFGGATLHLEGDRGAAVVRFAPDADGWPWMEARYAGPGALVICGFGVISRWGEGPSPRFLFARIIDRLVGRHPQQPVLKESR